MVNVGLSIVAFILLQGICRAQIPVDTARGLVGKEVALAFIKSGETLDSGATGTIEGEFKLKNPTIFYPQIFRGGDGVIIVEQRLDHSTDSTYSFTVSFRAGRDVPPNDTLFSLAGEALAGSDSTTDILFHNLSVDGRSIPDVTATIITESIGTRLPYVRFATLDPGRPNPTAPGITVTWGFRIDKASDVVFKFYDILGQEIAVQELGRLDKGVYVNTFTPDVFIPTGMFVVRLITNSGDAYQVMHVMR